MVTMVVSLSSSCGGLGKKAAKKERGFYATHESDATFLTTPGNCAYRDK
jgi:hypothetical protein